MRPLSSFILTVIPFLIPISIYSQTKTFIGILDNTWHEDANWDPFGIPAISDSIRIGQVVIIESDQTASGRTLHIQATGQVILEASTIAETTLFLAGTSTHRDTGLWNEGRIENQGHIQLFNHELGLYNSGVVVNKSKGLILTTNTQKEGITNLDSILNLGSIHITKNEDINSFGLKNERIFENKGSTTIDSLSGAGICNQSGQAQFLNFDSVFISEVQIAFIKNIDGIFANKTAAYLHCSNQSLVFQGILVDRSIFENEGVCVFQDFFTSTAIELTQDGFLRNRGSIILQDGFGAGIKIQPTGVYEQQAEGITEFDHFVGDYIEVDVSGILDLQGELIMEN